MEEYQPGVCNINEKESMKRKVMGAASLLNSMIITAVIFLFPSLTPLYAAIFILNFTGFLGFLQSQHHFCTNLALKKKFLIKDSATEVEDSEKVSKDRKKAATIITKSLVGSTILTTIIYLIAASF